MRIQRILNKEFIQQKILEDDDLIRIISEDGTDVLNFEPDVVNEFWIALVTDEGVRGFLIGKPVGIQSIQIHIAIFTRHWGEAKTNVALGQMGIHYLIQQGYRKFTAEIPTEDKHVLRYAQRCGLQREGVNKKSFLRNGEMIDQYYVGLVIEDQEI